MVATPKPVHTPAVMARHAARETMIRNGQANLQTARRAQRFILQQAVDDGKDPEAPMKLTALENDVAQANFEASKDVPIELTESERTQHSGKWRTYREHNARLQKHRGQAFSLVLGQCSQMLHDKMKQDTNWIVASTSCNPVTLSRLTEKTILAQTEDQHAFATVCEQELTFYSFRQETMSNPQWCKCFNTKVDVAAAVGITRQHEVLLECVAQKLHTQAFNTLTVTEQEAVREDAEERHLSHAFLWQSGPQHANLKVDLQNDFTTGDNHYPKNRQQTLHLLDKHSKTVVTKTRPS